VLPPPHPRRGVPLVLIRFGLHLDGLQPQRPATALGEVTLGPLGFLNVLETQLGLAPPEVSSADVLMAYRACLAECDRPERFYHASFAVDPINVGRTLLHWRAVLYEHGWNGRFEAPSPQRLRDLADVEALAADRVPLNRGQRARRIGAALERGRTSIERVELLDEIDELPRVWRDLAERLGCVETVTLAPHAHTGSDLRAVQDALVASVERRSATAGREASDVRAAERVRLRGDGSVVVLRGASRDITARAVAESIAADSTDDALVIAEHDGVILDNAFERSAMPRAGFQHYSRFRAVTQVLKLALALIWRPVSANLLLQFLIHPVGPLPRHVRDELADAVAEQPGIGGARWCAALERIEKRQREQFGADAKEIAATRAAIDDWFGGAYFDPSVGAPIAALSHRAQLCSTYFAMRLNGLGDDTERSLYANAFAQAEALLRALRSLGEQGPSAVSRIDLDRLIDEVSGAAPDPNTFAEARHVRATTDPATVTRPWRRIDWWDLVVPPRDGGFPWSRKEIAWLRDHGVALPDAAVALTQRTRRWLRPIVHARERLTLTVHDSEHGHHPLWTQIENLFDGLPEVRVDDALLNGGALDALGVATRPLDGRPLPAPRRWWQLPRDVPIAGRPVESYSSLSKMFDWPHGYVLRYAAQLRPGRAQDLADGNRLYGNLAHRLFERYFEENLLWSMLDAQGLRDWFAKGLPALIETEAAVLLEPGRGVDKQRVATTLERALVALIDHLRDAEIVSVQPELHVQAPFKSIEVGGDIDLLLTDRHGREIVLDVKWGSELYRAEDLRNNRQLQLATYSYLRKVKKRWPYQAFFIVESGHVLAQDASVFPKAVVCAPSSGESIEKLWKRIGASYDWRRGQLDAGLVEVNVDATLPTERSMPPDGALDVASDPDRFDDYVNVTGWTEYE
ncbi:MAG TPA: PD-(D/E)XK nuclease family protein, partial [Pseudomonadales bacterium]|nr:PD-(D/E)XK nuclease family protein [Pseudomonadales bacterium]